MEDGDGDGNGDGGDGLDVKQFFVASSLKLHVYWSWTIKNISLSL